MRGKLISGDQWAKVRVCIALTLIEDGVTSSPDVSAYAEQLGDFTISVSMAHAELERWYEKGYLTRWQTLKTFYYRVSVEGIENGFPYNI